MSRADAALSADTSEEPLAQSVARLRAERDGLRRAMYSRAVIEQAKGVLMARQRVTADQAFARLLEVSQRSNVKLAQVAAAVVATVSPAPRSAPAPAPPGWSLDGAGDGGFGQAVGDGGLAGFAGAVGAALLDGPAPPPTDAGANTRHVLTVARLHAAGSHDDIVAALAETRPAPTSVVLLLSEPDGALRLVAARGLTPEVASQWARIPPQVEIPLTEAVRRAVPVWLPDPDSMARAYPILAAIGDLGRSLAALPLTAAGRVVGVLGLTWAEPGLGGEHNRGFLAALGHVCGPLAARLAADSGPLAAEDAWLRPLLDVSLGASAVLRPVSAGGRVVDFVFEVLNAQAAAAAARVGVHDERELLLSELPGARAGLLDLYREVLADGRPRQVDDLTVPGVGADAAGLTLQLRAVRLGDRVVVSWRERSPAELLHDDLVATEREVGAASFRWRPAAGGWRYSPGLPDLLGWPGRDDPPTPLTAWRAVADPHWSGVRRAVVAALREDRPVTVRVVTRHGRWLRATLTRTAGGDLRGTVQDVTDLRSVLARQPGLARR